MTAAEPTTGERTTGRSTPALRRYLRSRLVPLTVLLVFVVSLTGPAAFLVLRFQELRLKAAATARGVAEVIHKEAYHRPVLWQYNTPKLVEHIRAYGKQADVRWIVVTDATGRPLALPEDLKGQSSAFSGTLWSSVPISVRHKKVGEVWVAVSTRGGRRGGGLVFFVALGITLGVLFYWIPMRAAARAEKRISTLLGALHESRNALAELNETLEQKVLERSRQLEETCRELQEKEEHLRQASGRAIAMQEAERRAIARELHDGVGQALTAMRINLQLMEERAADGEFVTETAARTLALMDETLREIRGAVRSLGPPALVDAGLDEALARFCDDFAERTGVRVERSIDSGGLPLSTAAETVCYRIVQEALTNTAKHADAGSVSVRIEAGDQALLLEIRDDGKGFAPDAALGQNPAESGRGLASIRERVELMGGTCTLESEPGQGTQLRVTLPLAKDDRPARNDEPPKNDPDKEPGDETEHG